MKTKLIGIFILLLSFSAVFSQPTAVFADTLLEQAQTNEQAIPESDLPQSGIVIEAENGQILWDQNADQEIQPVGLSNLMTVYLILEAIQDGTLSLDTVVTVTENHQAISQIPTLRNNMMVAGVEYSIADLIQLSLVASSNVATVMLSNALEEQDGAFVDRMNEKAQELGMTNTTFNSATGAAAIEFNGFYAPEGYDLEAENISTARDLALLTYHLINEFPDVLTYTNKDSVTILPDSLYSETFTSDNELLAGRNFATQGTDGLRFSSDLKSGFHGITTATRGGWQVITVLLGVGDITNPDSQNSLFALSSGLINAAFESYSYQELLPAGEQTINEQEVTVANDFYAVFSNDQSPAFTLADGSISLNNGLPTISETLPPLSVDYTEINSIEKGLAASPFIMTLLNIFEITKLTILALGMIALSFIFLLMSLFVPGVKAPEDSHIVSRSQRKAPGIRFPFKRALIVLGLLLLLSGIVIFSIQYLT